ncbi:MAG TPA: hypothetical protein VFJ19_04540 [Nocardioidaceae bacterium]|nr:hypothetical protein [Nocardioidaceae bacterium]
MSPVRVLRFVVGGLEVGAARQVCRWASGRRNPDSAAVVVCRLLGGRHVAQALLPTGFPGTGPTVDVLHMLTMVGVAGTSPAHRRAAVANTAEAACFALLAR